MSFNDVIVIDLERVVTNDGKCIHINRMIDWLLYIISFILWQKKD